MASSDPIASGTLGRLQICLAFGRRRAIRGRRQFRRHHRRRRRNRRQRTDRLRLAANGISLPPAPTPPPTEQLPGLRIIRQRRLLPPLFHDRRHDDDVPTVQTRHHRVQRLMTNREPRELIPHLRTVSEDPSCLGGQVDALLRLHAYPAGLDELRDRPHRVLRVFDHPIHPRPLARIQQLVLHPAQTSGFAHVELDVLRRVEQVGRLFAHRLELVGHFAELDAGRYARRDGGESQWVAHFGYSLLWSVRKILCPT